MIETLSRYLPQDRCRALSRGETLPDRTTGAALFADISGFTPLTEHLTHELGARRGVEELIRRINAVYDAIISEIERYGGSVISFAGDAITCWFDGDSGHRAVTAALAMQIAMSAFPQLGLKVAVTSGPARRFVVGDPAIQLLDALAGVTIARLATAEHLAARGEVVIDSVTAETLTDVVVIREWRAAENGEQFAVVTHIAADSAPANFSPCCSLDADAVRPWVLPAVFAREQSGHGVFLTELRPAVALFLRFTGVDYDGDALSGVKLDAFIRRTQVILTQHGGTFLDLIIGDKGSYLYAVFGAPAAHEDDARRAVLSALELRQLPGEFGFLHPLQIGISKGTMRTGAYGGSTRHTYGALGDEVNVAARLMGKSAPGEILVAGRVQNEVADLFEFGPCTLLTLKGKAAPLAVFAVNGQRRQRAMRLEEPHYTLPMIGRQAELAMIDAQLALALQGRGQVIGITAEAGLGKSRLGAEVIRLARQRGFMGYGGACEASGTNTPYLVWKSIWQAFFDVDHAMSLNHQIRALNAQIQAHAPTRIPAIPVLSPLLNIPMEENDFTRALEPKDRRNVLTIILEECLKSAAAREPVLLVLEDVHWIDVLSGDLLEALARVCANLPVCILLAYRPADTANLDVSRIESLPHFTRVTLNQLSIVEAEQFICVKLDRLFSNHSGALPETFTTQLMTRAEGNPFYLEELINYLHDRNINPYMANALTEIELPASLHALILSRIDRLNELQKVTLKTASIIGRMFSLTWLYGYYPALGDRERVKANLTELAHLDLTPLDTPEPELAYLFKHIMTREVTYESLPYATRAQLHDALARFIETVNADRYLPLLAYHYCQSANIAKQREYLRKAGEAAQAAFANNAALDYFTHLLPLLDDSHEQLELYLKRGAVRELLGQWLEAEADYRAALMIGEQVMDARAVARCQQMLGTLCRLRGDHDAALSWLGQACHAFTALDDTSGLALTRIETGRVWINKGELTIARQELTTGLSLACELSDQLNAALALNNLGHVVRNQGDHAAAQALYEESLSIFRKIGHKRGIAGLLCNLGVMAAFQGNQAAGQDLYTESLTLFREMGDKWSIAIVLSNLGLMAHRQGNYAAAQALHEESLAFRREIGDKGGIANALCGLGTVIHDQGDYAAARALYEESLTLYREIGDKRSIAIALNDLGNLAIEQHDLALAQTAYHESLKLSQEIGFKIGLVGSLSGLAARAVHQSDMLRTARLAAAAETLRVKLGETREPVEGRIYERAVAIARAGMSEAEFIAAWAEGEQMRLDDAIRDALTETQ